MNQRSNHKWFAQWFIAPYTGRMTTSFTVRLDDETEQKLAALTKDGNSRNTAIKYAIDVSYRAMLHTQMTYESAALLKDPEDLAEINAAREAMGSGDAW